MTSKATYNPYEILTDSLIEEALLKEFGNDVSLNSYKVVDFTKKGDNFASIVTSVQVNYDLHGTNGQQSYVAKLNPNTLTNDLIIAFFREVYLKEPVVLGPLQESMNKILIDLKQPLLKAPRCLSSCGEDKREVMVAEDLRNYGFVMFDKMKGMDFEHARFVMEELGRFHATSIVYDQQLEGITMEKFFPCLENPYIENPDHPVLEQFQKLLRGQMQMSIEILNAMEKSECVNKWWGNLNEFSSKIWFRNSEPSEKFSVLIHGDCWNNNMLFRYDKHGTPIDYRLVDFQMTLRSSPAIDLMYFFYTSLHGEMRQKYMHKLLIEYYLAFTKILLLARHPIPFDFEELKEELKSRMIFGCTSGMVVLPITLVNADEAISINEMMDDSNQIAVREKRQKFFNSVRSNPHVKTRFLSLFEEMTEHGIFERSRTIYNPYDQLTEALVEEALQTDIGKHVQLKAFEVKQFTNKGDNYAGKVVSIKVYYTEEGCRKDAVYVVKLNSQSEFKDLNGLLEKCYEKEILMLSTITEGMNKELKKLDLPAIKIPKILSFGTTPSKEIVIMNNLKLDGFVMLDRREGINAQHAFLVMEELGRFHASSILYEDTLKRPIREEFRETFSTDWITPDNIWIKVLSKIHNEIWDFSINLLTGLARYEKVIDWIESIKGTSAIHVRLPFDPDNTKFNVLAHGDCWTNNILFKYDKAGNPIDVRLIDLQVSRIVSAACDLNYFMYTSTTEDVRRTHKDHFLVQYYLSFSKILLLANKPIPFTFEELEKDFEKHMLYGCISAIITLPFLLVSPEDTISFEGVNNDNMEQVLDLQMIKFKEIASKNENFTKRFLSMFDEMIEHGIIK